MLYDIIEPIDTVFNAVDDVRAITELENYPYTAMQMVDMTYIDINKPPILRSGVRRCLCKNPANQTWNSFKNDFTTAHQ